MSIVYDSTYITICTKNKNVSRKTKFLVFFFSSSSLAIGTPQKNFTRASKNVVPPVATDQYNYILIKTVELGGWECAGGGTLLLLFYIFCAS